MESPHLGFTTTTVVSVAEATSTSTDRKSTRLNSSHLVMSYAVFCFKKDVIPRQLIALEHRQDRPVDPRPVPDRRVTQRARRRRIRRIAAHVPNLFLLFFFFKNPAPPVFPPSPPPPLSTL